ncbi:non-specific serine/threonine protein kinase [Plasmodiophora brassicae]
MYKDGKARKLDSKARRGIFVGYPEATKGYRVYDPVVRSKVAITRDVVFYEDQFGDDDDDEVPDLVSESEDDQDDDGGKEQEETQERRSERERKAPVRYGLDEYAGMAVEETLLTAQGDPRTRLEALESANAQEWQVAIDDELRALNKNQIWELCPRPAERKVIDGRWVFKLKQDQDGNPSRCKARYVARGFTQVPGTDFVDTYAPVASTTMQRALLSMAAMNDLEIYQLDIETSFQHQDVREELYIELPEGYVFPEGTSRKTHCGRLQKALYGLKQAAFELDRKIRDVLTKAGYTFSREDPCVFYRVYKGNYLVCTIHIDDLCVATTVRLIMYEDLKQALEKEFPVKDLGDVNFLLGCKIERDRKRRTLALSQQAYAKRAVERFNMHDAKPAATPSSTSMQLKKGPAVDSGFPYREAVGTLMYLAVMTRPDIMEAVSAVARFVECPTAEHATAPPFSGMSMPETDLRSSGSCAHVASPYTRRPFSIPNTIPCSIVLLTYRRMRFTAVTCSAVGHSTNLATALTASMISGRVMTAKYINVPTASRYGNPLSTAGPFFSCIEVELGVAAGFASCMLKRSTARFAYACWLNANVLRFRSRSILQPSRKLTSPRSLTGNSFSSACFKSSYMISLTVVATHKSSI